MDVPFLNYMCQLSTAEKSGVILYEIQKQSFSRVSQYFLAHTARQDPKFKAQTTPMPQYQYEWA